MKIIRDQGTAVGAILIVLGLVALTWRWFAFPDGIVIASVGLALLAAHLLTRHYAFLATGMIGLGAGIGTALQDYGYDPTGGFVGILAGAGFLAIYLVDVLTGTTARFWPVIPGTILVMIGGGALAQGTAAERWVEQLWPLILVAVGLVVLVATRRVRAPA